MMYHKSLFTLLTISIKTDRLILAIFEQKKSTSVHTKKLSCIPLNQTQIFLGRIYNVSSIAHYINHYLKPYRCRYATVALGRELITECIVKEHSISHESDYVYLHYPLDKDNQIYYQCSVAKINLFQHQVLALLTKLSYLCIVPSFIAYLHGLGHHQGTWAHNPLQTIDALYDRIYHNVEEQHLANAKEISATREQKQDSVELYGLYQLGTFYAKH